MFCGDFSISHVFAVIQHHLARIQRFYLINHLSDVIVGIGTIVMIHRRIVMQLMEMVLVVLAA
jgi:hypothetical protein